MLYKLIFLILIGFSLATFAQQIDDKISDAKAALFQTPQHSLDILFSLDKNTPRTIEQELQILDISVRAYETLGQINASENELEKLVKLAKNTGNQHFFARALRHRGDLHYTAGNYSLAEQTHREALSKFEQLGLEDEIAITLIALSSAVRTIGKYQEAIPLADKALTIYRALDNDKGTTSALTAIALGHKFLGNYAQALQFLEDGLSISLEIEDSNTVADTFYNIASIYVITEDYQQAKNYFTQALALDQAAGFKNDMAYDHLRLAEMDAKLGLTALAEQHITKAYQLFTEIGSMRNQGWALIVSGQIAVQKENFIPARDAFIKGIELAKQAEDRVLIVRGNMYLADLAYKMKEYDYALALIEEVFDDALERDNAHQITYILTLKGNILAAKSDYRMALKTRETLHNYQDKRNKELHGRTIALLQHNIDNQAKQHKIALLEKDQGLAEIGMQKVTLERNAGIAIAVMLLLVVLFWALKEREKRKVSAIRQSMLTESALRKDELLAEVSHELRTPLTVLRLHVESLQHDISEDPQTTYSMLNSKIDELNQLIEDLYQLSLADSHGLTITKASTQLKPFLTAQITNHRALAANAGLSLTDNIDIEPEQTMWIDAQRIQQILTNLFCNSIRYTTTPGSIHLTSNIANNQWLISIEDSAPGVDEQEIERLCERLYRVEYSRSRETGGAGLGLAICKTLVEAHQGRMEIVPSKLGGLCVTLMLPIQSQ